MRLLKVVLWLEAILENPILTPNLTSGKHLSSNVWAGKSNQIKSGQISSGPPNLIEDLKIISGSKNWKNTN